MKLVKIILITLFLTGLPIIETSIPSISICAQNISSNNWEYIGSVNIHSDIFVYEGGLYAKTLGNRIIYKVICYGKEYSVSKCENVKGYNAQISLGYLNVPEW